MVRVVEVQPHETFEAFASRTSNGGKLATCVMHAACSDGYLFGSKGGYIPSSSAHNGAIFSDCCERARQWGSPLGHDDFVARQVAQTWYVC